MKIRILLVIVSLAASVLIGLVLAARGPAAGAKRHGVTIGLSLDTLKEARWQADRDMFVKRADELGARVLVLAANSDDTVQIGDVEKLITNGVDVLVIVPHDGTAWPRPYAWRTTPASPSSPTTASSATATSTST